MIIINADDWGRSKQETDIPLDFYRQGRITSVTAMVFMEDSERAAEIARHERIPTGLHLNFIEPFSARTTNPTLSEQQRKIVEFLTGSRYHQLIYNPLLVGAFEYVFRAQLDEFCRLYGHSPSHYDGHQHMHVCTNMLTLCPIPRGSKVRRSFSFGPRDKGVVNRGYRSLVNLRLASRYRIADYFFALSQQLNEERFTRVCSLASHATVELMTHPAVVKERAFLGGEAFGQNIESLSKGTYVDV